MITLQNSGSGFFYVPIVIGEFPDLPFLETVQAVDFGDSSPQRYRQAFQRLLWGLKQQSPGPDSMFTGELRLPKIDTGDTQSAGSADIPRTLHLPNVDTGDTQSAGSADIPRTFVCYARKDQEFALALAIRLKDAGVAIWLDQWDIPLGADWDTAIDEALDSSPRFLIILSPAATASPEVKGELHTALEQKKYIVPVLYQACRIPRQLLAIQRVTLTRQDLDNEMALKQLTIALRGKSGSAGSGSN
jgi:TIR domain